MSELPRKKVHHYDGEGHARELTFSCYQRQKFFSKPHEFDGFFLGLTKAREKCPIHIWAYVVMPEHVHLLVWPTEKDFPISTLLDKIKSSVSKRARSYLLRENPTALKETDSEFHFWQAEPGYDRNLDNDATVWAGIDYIHRNPIRRNLCARSEDWLWSSAGIYAGLQSGPVEIDRDSLPPDPRR